MEEEEAIIRYPLFVPYDTREAGKAKNEEITATIIQQRGNAGGNNYANLIEASGKFWLIMNSDTAQYFSEKEKQSALPFGSIS